MEYQTDWNVTNPLLIAAPKIAQKGSGQVEGLGKERKHQALEDVDSHGMEPKGVTEKLWIP